MISNNKIYRLAKKFYTFFESNPINPSDVVMTLTRQRLWKEYYDHLGPDGFIKLCIAVWGISQEQSQSEIEDIFDKLFFATVFYTEGESYYETCDYCNGDGRERCENCDGTGREECDECGGSGEVTCTSCDGSGEIEGEPGEMERCDQCDGEGEEECSECSGSGELTCGNCGGDGDTYCDNCDGDGNIQSDELLYDVDYIVCWDTKLLNKFELEEGTNESVMDLSDYLNNHKIMVIGKDSEQHAEIDEFETDEVYCLNLSNNRPSSIFTTTSSLYFFSTPAWDIDQFLV